MQLNGGFEGNAQTLRILTELIYERPGNTKGIAPTRAFLDGVMKYKALHKEWISQDGKAPKNHFIYDAQKSGVIHLITGRYQNHCYFQIIQCI